MRSRSRLPLFALAIGSALLGVGTGVPAVSIGCGESSSESAAGGSTDAAVARGQRYLLATQLDDGTWHVHRRAFPFQPTMTSGFPHGRDAWISAAATSWAVMALSLPDEPKIAALKR